MFVFPDSDADSTSRGMSPPHHQQGWVSRRLLLRQPRLLLALAAVVLVATVGVIFDATTPPLAHPPSSASTVLEPRASLGLPTCRRDDDDEKGNWAILRNHQERAPRGGEVDGVDNDEEKMGSEEEEEDLDSSTRNATTTSSSSKIFISLAVCWSANTNMHHKSRFPYRLATRCVPHQLRDMTN